MQYEQFGSWFRFGGDIRRREIEADQLFDTVVSVILLVMNLLLLRMPAPRAVGMEVGAASVSGFRQWLGRLLGRFVPMLEAGATEEELAVISTIRAAHPELALLTNREILAIRAYTGEEWAAINASLRGATGPSSTTSALTTNMNSGLNKLPGYTGRLVRSEALPIEEAVARYVPGETFTAEGMLSTSSRAAAAQREGNIAMTIHAVGRRGKDVSAMAVHAESEILFLSGTRFTVVQATRVRDALVVVLREL
jgi:hypothetical protein